MEKRAHAGIKTICRAQSSTKRARMKQNQNDRIEIEKNIKFIYFLIRVSKAMCARDDYYVALKLRTLQMCPKV